MNLEVSGTGEPTPIVKFITKRPLASSPSPGRGCHMRYYGGAAQRARFGSDARFRSRSKKAIVRFHASFAAAAR